MNIFEPSARAISRAADIIRSGGLVAFPTETVYGLGADASNPEAVIKIFETKRRPLFDPLIVHASDMAMLESVVSDIPPAAKALMESFWPGPLTIVLPKSSLIPEITTSGLDTVAVRMPAHETALELIRAAGLPIAAPSANLFGRISPTTARHVADQLGPSLEMILDGGPCSVGVESTIVSISPDGCTLLRPGGIPVEEISAFTGPVLLPGSSDKIQAPGSMPSHYAPRAELIIKEKITSEDSGSDRALLFFREPAFPPPPLSEILSVSGDLREAAINLFAALHRLDRLNRNIIIAEEVPSSGLGLAIMDRLRRASVKP